MIQQAKEYALKVHSGTNHLYDGYLPYEYHLRHVVRIAHTYMYLIEQSSIVHQITIAACWLHDTIEDCRINYSDIVNVLTDVSTHGDNRWLHPATQVAEIVRAVTNDQRGRNRAERMTDECYNDIATVPGALFVKLCDRIANVEYSKMTISSQLDMYRKEHRLFTSKLRTAGNKLGPMWEHLDNLLK